MVDLGYYQSLLAQINEPLPTPLPEQDTRAGEAMAGRHDDKMRRERKVRVETATRELIEALPILLTNFEALMASQRNTETAIRQHAEKHGPNGGGWNISMVLDALSRVPKLVDQETDWKPIETYPKIAEEFVLLACADWIGDIPVKIGEWRDGKWHIFGGSWEPTHWRELPKAPARIPKRPFVEPWVDGKGLCHVLVSPECETGVVSGFTTVSEGLRNHRITVEKSGKELDAAPITMCNVCKRIVLSWLREENV